MTTSPLVSIIDDDADYRFLFQRVFTRYYPSCAVSLFANGQALWDALPHMQHQPSLILMDRYMPQLDGYQTLLRLKGTQAYHKIPVVMMSAAASTAEINDCYTAGANSFFQKHTDLASLRETSRPSASTGSNSISEACCFL